MVPRRNRAETHTGTRGVAARTTVLGGKRQNGSVTRGGGHARDHADILRRSTNLRARLARSCSPLPFAHAKAIAAGGSPLPLALLLVWASGIRVGKKNTLFAGVRGWSCQHDLAAQSPAPELWSVWRCFTRSCCSFTLSQPASWSVSCGSCQLSLFTGLSCDGSIFKMLVCSVHVPSHAQFVFLS